MIGIKDGNGDLVSLANKSDKWAVYATKAAAEEALVNDELAEGMMVGVTEAPGVISEGSSVMTTKSVSIPTSIADIDTFTNTTGTECDYYFVYDTNQSNNHMLSMSLLVNGVVVDQGNFDWKYGQYCLQGHLNPGDTAILRGYRHDSTMSGTGTVVIQSKTIEYVTDKLYAIEPNYSTTEVNTGKKWIDGKTIYRKCYYNATNWANNTVIDTIPNVSYVVNLISVSSTNTNEIYQNYSDGSSRNDANFNTSNGKLSVRRSAVFVNSYPASVIIEYTKTE